MTQTGEHHPDTGIGAIGREVADDAVRLVRAEIALAKAQLRDAAIRMAVAIALIVLALLLLFIGSIEALSAIPSAFSVPLFHNTWVGWAVFGGLFVLLAAGLGGVGILTIFRSVKEGKQTVNTFKEDAEWVRGLTRRGGSES